MPNYETHTRIGLATSLIISTVLVIFFLKELPLIGWKLYIAPIISIFYSNLPDLDHHMGKLRKMMFLAVFIAMIFSALLVYLIDIYLMFLIFALIGLIGAIILFMPHRGILHTYWLVLIASAPLLYIHWFLALIALLSGFSHIFIDRLWSWFKK